MSGRLNSLRADLRRTTDEAREQHAETLFDLEEVRKAMTKAARFGYGFCQIESPDGLDLRVTVAAKAAIEWLAEQGIASRWEVRAGSVGADGATAWTLTVSWAKTAAAE